MRKNKSLDRQYFEDLYKQDGDPWKFASSPYEQAKYEQTLAALGDEPVRRALEIGCSIGVLTEKLAGRCDRLTATDMSEIALEQARLRCAPLVNVDFRLVASTGQSFEGLFDLIVLSEVVYYWDEADLSVVADGVKASMEPGGRILLVHWLGETDYPKSADDALAGLEKRLSGLYETEKADRTQDYRLDLWRWKGAA